MRRGVAVAGLALLATACTANLQDAPVTMEDPVVEALSWIRHLSPGAEGVRKDPKGRWAKCRAYTDSRGAHYLAYHHPLSLELMAIYEVREWAGGVREVLVWERPEEEEPIEADKGKVL